ncbi:MAG TPA: oxidoreductase [Jiangellaceae bacterium]
MPEWGPRDPFADVATLSGVGAAASHARDALDALLRHPAVRRDARRLAGESVLRGARASAVLAGGNADDLADPILQGALRATGEVPTLAATWERAPGQVLARIHVLAARDLVPVNDLGRPRPGADARRLEQLLQLAVARTGAPGVIVAAIVHGELRAIDPFGSAGGLVARATERLVLMARGVDTRAVGVPEAGHRELAAAYEPLVAAYVAGGPDGVAAWVRHCCDAYARGAEAGLAHASGAPG